MPVNIYKLAALYINIKIRLTTDKKKKKKKVQVLSMHTSIFRVQRASRMEAEGGLRH